jgi:hypothetical protein
VPDAAAATVIMSALADAAPLSFADAAALLLPGQRTIALAVNYRPPSSLGNAVPTSERFYNAHPLRAKNNDFFPISQRTGTFGVCAPYAPPNAAKAVVDADNPCACTSRQRTGQRSGDSGCITKVRSACTAVASLFFCCFIVSHLTNFAIHFRISHVLLFTPVHSLSFFLQVRAAYYNDPFKPLFFITEPSARLPRASPYSLLLV